MKTTNFILILILCLFVEVSFSQINEKDIEVIRFKKVLALELCNKNEFNVCSNFSPIGLSKTPELIPFYEDRNTFEYDTIYRQPTIELSLKLGSKIDDLELSEFIENPNIKTDTLKYNLTKKQVRKVKKHIRNAKKSLDYDVDYSTDGKLKYLLYEIDFECLYGGKGKTYAIDENGCKLILEKEVKIYYLTKIISIKPKK